MKIDIEREAQRLLRNPLKLKAKVDELVDPKKLTTPADIDPNVKNICRQINPDAEPFFIAAEPELWSRQSCCDLNVRRYIELHGGDMLCGYKIWYNAPIYLEAERHAIWADGSKFRDVTFNADGEDRILFVPDTPERAKALDDNAPRKRWSVRPDIRAIIRAYEIAESHFPLQRMSHEEAWKTMPSYEEWLAGKRMPSVVMKVSG